jgi:hypothetical protein
MPLSPMNRVIKAYQSVRPNQAILHDLENHVLRQINLMSAAPSTNWLERLLVPQHRWASATATVAFSFFTAYLMLGMPDQAVAQTANTLGLNVFASEYATPLYQILR